ncbi:hypothetical protein SNEBB_009491 [Seison nebaliae]|nr:hypothetical protein SNEBB_009491 [Seison nebaliae]
MLVPFLNDEKWIRTYDTLFSEKADLAIMPYNIFPYEVTNDWTTKAYQKTRRSTTPIVIENDNESEQIMRTLAGKIVGKEKGFQERYQVIFSTDSYGFHYLLVVLDLEKGVLITYESCKNKPRMTDINANYLVHLLGTLITELDIPVPYSAITDKHHKWEIMVPHTSSQSDLRSCGFYTLINLKYLAHRIMPIFKNREILQLKFLLGYELYRKKLFPLG